MVIAKDKKEPILYVMQGKISKSSTTAIKEDETFDLLHKRLYHMSEKGLSIMAKKNVLLGLKNVSLKKYDHCLADNQSRFAFKSSLIQES